ncbi:MAG: hypothetical protein DRJ03_30005 [Chloroflexi bacterium]|nr:MAG: hypothetical protein DRJ03_30005 [Chloroflexota bacterium]
MKVCKKCGEEKPLDDFYRHSQMKDGHLNECKVCRRAYQKRLIEENPEKRAAYERARAQRPERKKVAYEVLCRWRKNNPEKAREQANRYPEKRRARTAVGNAVRDGILKKEPCADCGSEKVHAHHEDCSKPLEVEWLCAKCHRKRHVGG